MGFNKVAQYYYYPGWHEPGSVLELLINRQAWENLSDDLKMIVQVAADAQNMWMLAQFDAQNGNALQELVAGGTELRPFSDEVMAGLEAAAEEVKVEVADSDPQAAKVYDSFRKFQNEVASWGTVSEQSYYNLIQTEDT
jgi:TRAP-type mannitol/chloroaromatic compound transport system substrate-binding protein